MCWLRIWLRPLVLKRGGSFLNLVCRAPEYGAGRQSFLSRSCIYFFVCLRDWRQGVYRIMPRVWQARDFGEYGIGQRGAGFWFPNCGSDSEGSLGLGHHKAMTFSRVTFFAAGWLLSLQIWGQEIKPLASKGWAMAVHGGAGSGEWEHMDAATAAAYRAALGRALQAGVAKLSRGGRSLDAVEAAINVMEDDPLFNAGRGAVFTAEGRNEMDAAI